MLCGDEAYRCFGVETGCAEAGENRGVVRVRGGVTPPGKAGRRGDRGRLQAVTGSLHFFARGRAYGVVKTIFPKFTGSEWCRTYCGIILPLSYDLR